MGAIAAVRVAAVVAVVLLLPGWALARARGGRLDLFARVWTGLGVTSIVGLALAQARVFSLGTLLAALGALAALGLAVGRVRRSASSRDAAPWEGAPAPRRLAVAAAFLALVWCWPPFETILGASDSTMYLAAGVHLARTGSLAVHDSVVPLLPRRTALELFASVSMVGTGPYIRLPGGLLMGSLESGEALPAFFPLTSVWAAILAAAGGPEAAPVIASLFAALALWAVALFAGEAFGLATGAATALLMLANFAFWWFGRFPLSECLTLAFVWGGLVMLGRGSAFGAGLLFGLGGLARTETFPFLIAGVVLWASWTRVPGRDLVRLALGFALVSAMAGATLAAAPSHHRAYLMNDVYMTALSLEPRMVAAFGAGYVTKGMVAVVVALLLVGAVGRRAGVGFVRAVVGTAALSLLAGGLALYLRYAGQAEPLRHLRWLAAYCSWPVLVMAVGGGVLAWRRGGTAAHLAVCVWLLVATFFGLNPRVALYQPWAIRRFLPIVIPGLLIAAGVLLAAVGGAGGRGRRAVSVLALLLVLTLELRPIATVWKQRYFAGSFDAVALVAASLADGALAAVESEISDVQLQVPLWLAHGRETVVLRGDTRRWQTVMAALVASGRPVYWITQRAGGAVGGPGVPGLTFRPIVDADVAVRVPDGPADEIPTRAITRLVPLRVYGVSREPA